jgi:four helix bundle protein
MSISRDFRDLKVWEKSHTLVLDIYRVTMVFPKEELYSLTSQIRRSAASIPSNIAEGCGKGSDAELGRYMQIAMGSASELEYHLLLSHDLSYIDHQQYQKLNTQLIEVKKMLAPFIKKLKS